MVLLAYAFVCAEFMVAHPGNSMVVAVRDPGAVSSAIGAASNYPGGVFQKGAVLFRSLVKNHAFSDGNKRTAVLVTFMFLRRNGFDPSAPAERWTNIATTVAAAEGTYPVDRICRSLKKCVRRVPDGRRANSLAEMYRVFREKALWIHALPPFDRRRRSG